MGKNNELGGAAESSGPLPASMPLLLSFLLPDMRFFSSASSFPASQVMLYDTLRLPCVREGTLSVLFAATFLESCLHSVGIG